MSFTALCESRNIHTVEAESMSCLLSSTAHILGEDQQFSAEHWSRAAALLLIMFHVDMAQLSIMEWMQST